MIKTNIEKEKMPLIFNKENLLILMKSVKEADLDVIKYNKSFHILLKYK